MTRSMRSRIEIAGFAALLAILLTLANKASWAQESLPGTPSTAEPPTPAQGPMPGMMHRHGGPGMHGLMMHGETKQGAVEPVLAGQDAFGAIQEIVHILEADPKTDWSKVNLEALRQHFIDMAEVTLNANATVEPVDGGIEAKITGSGRTIEAIQRMVPAHAHVIESTHLNGWSAKTDRLDDGVVLTVTAKTPKEVAHIRGLGFIGVMASGHHHRPHHLAMARGEMVHER